jgi:hypothetical protein
MIDHKSLRLSAILLFVGELLSIVAGLLHPSRENANVHSAVFAEYAESSDWTLVHLGQFVGMAIIIAGFIALFFALNVPSGTAGWAGRFGVVSAVVALALYGMLQAVDGVALKQAVNAWVNAPDAEKTARFASAEAIRWLEWAIRSYQSFMLGLAFVLIAIMIVLTARIPSPIGYLIGLSGLAYIVQGFILGSEGFSPANSMPQLLAYILVIAWSIWLLSIALRAKVAAEAAS